MSWAMVASAAASVIGGAMASSAASDAGDAASAATQAAAAQQMAMFKSMKNDLKPWVGVGNDALARLSVLTGLRKTAGTAGGAGGKTWQNFFDEALGKAPQVTSDAGGHWGTDPRFGDVGASAPVWMPGGEMQGPDRGWATTEADKAFKAYQAEQSTAGATPDDGYGDLLKKFSLADFEADPGYLFRKEEGEKALTRGQLARGLHASTPGLKELMRFNQGLASQEYGAAWTRDAGEKARTFDYLQALSLGGQNAATQTGVSGINAGATSGALLAQAGQISAQAGLSGAGALSSGINAGVGNYMYQQRFDKQMDLWKNLSVGGGGALNFGNTGDFNLGTMSNIG